MGGLRPPATAIGWGDLIGTIDVPWMGEKTYEEVNHVSKRRLNGPGFHNH